MNTLEKNHRTQLERTIQQAREIAEQAARASMEQLGIAVSQAYAHLSEQEKDLRRRLRVHSRQLGDERFDDGTQQLDRLVEEIAYEHWHRMLFARFLAENNLLMYGDEDPIDIDLETCQELLDDGEENYTSVWEFAAYLAAKMLPQIFRLDSPVFELKFAANYQLKLERLVSDLEKEVFISSDGLGWIYQYWQAKRKEEVNASEVKIGEREISAVTQLFTEPYMVAFLLDNSLGAWWVGKVLTQEDFKSATSEEELREKSARNGLPLTYLRFVQQKNGSWISAAGTFDKWPDDIAQLKILDPCCGSGHFLVSIINMMVPMRMELENISETDAIDRILTENLYGLELDKRCVELAAFAVALTSWKYPNAGGHRSLPALHLACSGLSVTVERKTWSELAPNRKNVRIAMDWMYDVFKDAPVLGSLIDPTHEDATTLAGWEELSSVLNQALSTEQTDEVLEAAVAAKGLAKAADLLSQKYHLIVTNVPYLLSRKQDSVLKKYCEKHFPEAKNDLATVFLDRCLELCYEGGTTNIVLPQNWLFLTSYKKFREKLLKRDTWNLLARLGAKGFQTPMWDFNILLINITSGGGINPERENKQDMLFVEKEGEYHLMRGMDVSEQKKPAEKAEELIQGDIKEVEQVKQLENLDARVQFELNEKQKLLLDYVDVYHGISTTDYVQFGKYIWEFDQINNNIWIYRQSSIKKTIHFSGLEQLLKWENNGAEIRRIQKLGASVVITGLAAWEHKGVAVSQMGKIPCATYLGCSFDDNIGVLIPKNENNLIPVMSFCQSSIYGENLRVIDQANKIAYKTLNKIPFNLEEWMKKSNQLYPFGYPAPYTNYPTQWIFHGHPCGSVIWDEEKKRTAIGNVRIDDTVLHVVIARLLGYRWPAELDPKMELADEQRSWVLRCESLLSYADTDGIVCISSVHGEVKASDRILSLLAASYGEDWEYSILEELLSVSGYSGRSLETWLRDGFFTQHCKLFQKRPFIWQIWDGLKDGFSVLINYHKLDRKLLETLIYTYLGDWISQQKKDMEVEVDGAQAKYEAALILKERLELILEGEAPYDIFIRWKPLSEQPIGWNPDLNDGVRLNIRPFMSVPDIRKKGAGVLRDKPNIKWEKDRGKDVKSAPWYHLFGGDRINDHHLTLEEKRNTRR